MVVNAQIHRQLTATGVFLCLSLFFLVDTDSTINANITASFSTCDPDVSF